MPDLLKTCKGPRTSARALLSSPLWGAAHLLVPYTENTKDGDLSMEKREKLRQRACTWFTKSHSCFVEELRFKPSQKCLQTTLCSQDPKEQQFAHEMRSSRAHWDAAQPDPTPSRSQNNKISAPGYWRLLPGLETLTEAGFSAHWQISFFLSSRNEPARTQSSIGSSVPQHTSQGYHIPWPAGLWRHH